MTAELATNAMTDEQTEAFRQSVRIRGRGPRAYIDIPPATLVVLYCDLHLSMQEIAVILGVGERAVRLRMIEHGTPIRTAKDAFAVSSTHGWYSAGRGPDSPYWKGGRKYNQGYVMVYRPDHADAAKYLGYVFEHRLVAEEMIGRPIADGEEVHHRNEVRDDNRPENLEVISKSDHMSHHARKRHAAGDPTFGFKKKGGQS